jgi:antitoxin MazE
MLVSIIPIGNSKGIRIPKSILKQLGIREKVELEVHSNEIHIKPVNEKPRTGWEEAFAIMHQKGDDTMLLQETLDEEEFEWEW